LIAENLLRSAENLLRGAKNLLRCAEKPLRFPKNLLRSAEKPLPIRFFQRRKPGSWPASGGLRKIAREIG